MRVILIMTLMMLKSLIYADVKGLNGVIEFDNNNDQQSEMSLSTTGLAIGIASASANLHVNGNAIVTDQITIGSTTSQSNINLGGTNSLSSETISSNASINDHSLVFLDTSSDNLVLNLPYAGNVANRIYKLKKVSSLNSAYITGGGNSIDNLAAVEFAESSLSGMTVISDGTKWVMLDSFGSVGTIASDNLIAWYPFDQTTGTLLTDSSTENNSGNLVGGLSFTNDSVTGKIGQSLRFDGTDDYISLNATSDLYPGDVSFTISVWFKTTTLHNTTDNNVGGRLVTLQRTTAGSQGSKVGLAFYGDNSDTLHVYYHHGFFSSLFGAGVAFNDGKWNHVAVTYDRVSDELVLYYNGVILNSVDAGTITSGGTEPARIGSFNGVANEKFNGDMDDLRLYNISLTPLQVQALFLMGHE